MFSIKKFVIFTLHFGMVFMLEFRHRVPERLWQERCSKNTLALNDCNWCWCDKSAQFQCSPRQCNEVDMFGHFNDAIQEIDVGMEGHGAWRSSNTACDAGVRYRRKDLVCYCTEEGTWPNPICRDNLRILHPVEPSVKSVSAEAVKCSPTKLYLIGCNVCFCPSSGVVDPNMCTKKTCLDDDPILNASEDLEAADRIESDEDDVKDIYAKCEMGLKYKIGCKTCVCQRNNRLICNKCTGDDVSAENVVEESTNECSAKRPNEIFSIDCNLCYCNEDGFIFCTARKCLTNDDKDILRNRPVVKPNTNTKIKKVAAPIDDQNCIPGTKFMKDCNTCFCAEDDAGMRIVSCTFKKCSGTLRNIQTDCVNDTIYEKDCLICNCNVEDGKKWEICQFNKKCASTSTTSRTKDLNSLHGYCEPLHIYNRNCNTCRCLSSGKTLMCSSKNCNGEQATSSANPVSVDILPVKGQGGSKCAKGQTFKIDCNFCFCLTNGNVLCTTAECKNKS